MGHTKPEMLGDLAGELQIVTSRWADVKTPRGYREVKIEFHADAGARRKFLGSVQDAHALLAKKRSKSKR